MIYDFLPKYPSIEDKDFNQLIYQRKEFYDQRLEAYESKPSKPGDLMRHQTIISRFISNHTTYDGLLLFHDMGTGKSCSAFGTIENLLSSKSSSYKRAIVIARGKGIITNLINELVFTCTDGKYIPNDYKNLSREKRNIRIRSSLKTHYEFNTFYRFAKSISKLSSTQIREKYSNSIIVIDEVHNIRETPKDIPRINIYNTILKFMDTIQNKKVLLLSGTPMKDRPDEFSSIINLILPADQRLVTGKQFIKKYVSTDQHLDELKNKIKGRVSYLRPIQDNDVNIEYIGKLIGNMNVFPLYTDIMQEPQLSRYIELYTSEHSQNPNIEKASTGLYSGSRQAALFVFPDGSSGSQGFRKYVKITKKKTAAGVIQESYRLSNELVEAIRDDNIKNQLNNLRKYSSKYANVIQNILEAKDKSIFIYSTFVQGSGSILFSKILELFDFSRANGTERTVGSRYAIFTNMTTTSADINRIIERFNRSDNSSGQYIKVIIGSRVIGEGFSFKNIQNVHILTPHWNFSEIQQAIARAIRSFSHTDLIRNNKGVNVKIYLHASLTSKKIYKNSIDYNIYLISENKDRAIKRIEYIAKTSAFDCALNYNRNYRDSGDGSRDCNYTNCNYVCNDITDINPSNIDISTYELYYNKKEINNLTENIVDLYKTNFILSFQQINSLINISTTEFELLTSLDHIITYNIPITNKYGFTNYLREDGNLYYIIGDIIHKSNFLTAIYEMYPTLYSDISFEHIVEQSYYKSLPRVIQILSQYKDIDTLNSLPKSIKNMLLEMSILAKSRDIKSEFRDFILDFYAGYVQNAGGVYISTFLDLPRCLINNEFVNCPDDIQTIISRNEDEQLTRLENNKFGYYGIIEKGNFLIRDIQSKEKDDLRKITKGKRCETWNKQELIYILDNLGIYNLEMPMNQKKLLEKIKKNKTMQLLVRDYKELDLTKLSVKRLSSMLENAELSKKKLCNKIKEFFLSNDLVLKK